MMERQIHVMSRLLDDLLDISRLSRDRLDLQMTRVDLAEVVASAVETSRPLLDGLGHRLVIALPPDPIVLDADAVRLEQVLANLLNNAARYTPTGGRIEISARREGTTAVVSVSDNGVGITAEEMPRLFEIFAQAKPALERASGGLGIGLSLARGLVERHGGTVEARSGGAGQGSEFVVRLPVSHESVAVSGTAPPEIAAPVRRLTVLVVDDLRDSADSLAEFIRAMGHVVHTSYDGDSALATAREVRPDVVLLDLGMPGVTGYETCRRIRQDARERRPYIVAVTGFGQEQDRLRTAAAGFDHHLVKPVPPATLSRLLSSVAAG
jgi:CheY-like chemotaxis protein